MAIGIGVAIGIGSPLLLLAVSLQAITGLLQAPGCNKSLPSCNKRSSKEALLAEFLAQWRFRRLERGEVGKDFVVALFARYCREPQAFDLGVQFHQAVGLVIDEVLIALFQGLIAQLHDVELGQIGEIHLQEVILLKILELEAGAQEFNDPASLVTPQPLCGII
jgi:hypothetical protein